jgi:hypothetical protein
MTPELVGALIRQLEAYAVGEHDDVAIVEEAARTLATQAALIANLAARVAVLEELSSDAIRQLDRSDRLLCETKTAAEVALRQLEGLLFSIPLSRPH